MENNLKGDTQNLIHYIFVGTSEKLSACKCIPYKCVVSKSVSLLQSLGVLKDQQIFQAVVTSPCFREVEILKFYPCFSSYQHFYC